MRRSLFLIKLLMVDRIPTVCSERAPNWLYRFLLRGLDIRHLCFSSAARFCCPLDVQVRFHGGAVQKRQVSSGIFSGDKFLLNTLLNRMHLRILCRVIISTFHTGGTVVLCQHFSVINVIVTIADNSHHREQSLVSRLKYVRTVILIPLIYAPNVEAKTEPKISDPYECDKRKSENNWTEQSM